MLTQERLKEVLHYDPDTGIWTRRFGHGGKAAGSRAGTIHTHGYRHITIDGARHYEHRLAFLYMIGRWPDPEGEHRNRIKSDNRWENLREATKSQNQQNAHSTASKTGYRGVYAEPRTGRFYAQIRVNGQRTSLGTFDTAEEANEARNRATREHHGEFAYSPSGAA